MSSMTIEPTKLDQDHEWAQLIALTAQGDQAALATFYDRTSPQVFGFISRILNNREAAEEVTLDVYTQVWRQAHTYDATRGAPGAWLMTVARTRAIDRLRARATESGRLESLEAVELFAGDDETPEQTSAMLGEWARSGLVNILGGCCGTTPDHVRMIAEAAAGVAPRQVPERPRAMRLSGLEPFELAS